MSKDRRMEVIADICPFYKEFGSCEKCRTDFDDGPCYWECMADAIINNGYRKQEWISVDERLPEDNGDELIVCTEDGFVGAARFTAVIEEGFCWMENEGSDFYDGDLIEGVTHWMPLPKPPKMKGGE